MITVTETTKALLINEKGEMFTGDYKEGETIPNEHFIGERDGLYIFKYQISNNPPLMVLLRTSTVSM